MGGSFRVRRGVVHERRGTRHRLFGRRPGRVRDPPRSPALPAIRRGPRRPARLAKAGLRPRDRVRHGSPHSGHGGEASGSSLHHRDRPQSADARSGGGARHPARRGVETGRRAGPSLSGRELRRRRLPVRRHVLSGPPARIRGGAPRAAEGRRISLQLLGSHRRQRTRAGRSGRPRAALSGRSSPVHGAHAARLRGRVADRGRSRRGRLRGRAPRRNRGAAQPRPIRPEPAAAFCLGTPLRGEIESHGGQSLEDALRAAEEALARRFGNGEIDARMQAHIVEIER